MNANQNSMTNPRPWWFVRVELLAVLAILVTLLVTIIWQPEFLDRGLGIAGL